MNGLKLEMKDTLRYPVRMVELYSTALENEGIGKYSGVEFVRMLVPAIIAGARKDFSDCPGKEIITTQYRLFDTVLEVAATVEGDTYGTHAWSVKRVRNGDTRFHDEPAHGYGTTKVQGWTIGFKRGLSAMTNCCLADMGATEVKVFDRERYERLVDEYALAIHKLHFDAPLLFDTSDEAIDYISHGRVFLKNCFDYLMNSPVIRMPKTTPIMAIQPSLVV